MKPQVGLDYNEGKLDIDLSDQLSAYDTWLRRSIKWYQYVTFELMFRKAIVNSYLGYNENYATSNMTMPQFRESFVRSLLLVMPFEKLQPCPRQQSASHSKRKPGDQKLEEKKGPEPIVRRRCAGCYEKIRQEQSREASNTTAKKIKTFCSDCDNCFFLDCFNEQYYATQ